MLAAGSPNSDARADADAAEPPEDRALDWNDKTTGSEDDEANGRPPRWAARFEGNLPSG